MERVELSILLPVRNEGINLRIMLKMLRAVVEVTHEVVIVHDDSDDDSVALVGSMQAEYPNVRCVHNTGGRGVVHALKAGIEAAHGELILIFAADEVGPVLAIEDMLALAREGCEFVSCTRYAHGGRRLGGSLIGGMLSRLANRLFHTLAHSALTDATTGIKLFPRELYPRLQLTARPVGWAIAFEMSMKAQLLGLKLGEVPIVSIDRLYGGQSTFKLGPWCLEYLRWFFWGIRELRGMKGVRPVEVRIPLSTAPTGPGR